MVEKKSDLGYLGEEYQFKLMRVFFEDKDFFIDLYSIIHPNMFTNPQLRKILSLMIDFYKTQEIVPSFEMMGIVINKSANGNETERLILESVLHDITTTSLEAIDWIKHQAFVFFKQQNIVKTANKILEIAGNGDSDKYEECVELLNDALRQGNNKDMGVTVMDDLEDTLSNDYRVPIPTGLNALDECLNGGIGKGELAVIIGSSGFGKTSLTTAIANHAATYKCENNNQKGYKVLQIVFEDSPKQIRRKHIARITGIEARDLSKPEYIDVVRQRLSEYEDMDILNANLRIVRFPSGDKTATDIKNFIKNLINSGFIPDLCIVDYFECIDNSCFTSITNDFEREGKTMRKFEAMAQELNLAMIIPSQGTKDALKEDVIDVSKMSGSAKKAQISHIILSISRTLDDIDNNRATIALLKNRSGLSGKVWEGCEFNNGTCRMSTDTSSEFGSMLAHDNAIKEERERNKLETVNFIRDAQRKEKYSQYV